MFFDKSPTPELEHNFGVKNGGRKAYVMVFMVGVKGSFLCSVTDFKNQQKLTKTCYRVYHH